MSWVLWSRVFKTAVVLIPEEAEQVIRMMHTKATHPTIHLLTYASPVTRRMMEFNNLTFFSIPQLPKDWEAPQWLKTELGLLAGRLYFQWGEHAELRKFLGVAETDNPDPAPLESEAEDDAVTSEDEVAEDQDEKDKAIVASKGKNHKVSTSFAPRPLAFLQDWLAVRRHGQDFVHTPMGFLTQGKKLQETHPFFSEGISTSVQPMTGSAAAETTLVGGSRWDVDDHGDHVEEGAMFDGVDDMGANVGDANGEEEGIEVVYDESEWFDSGSSGSETKSE